MKKKKKKVLSIVSSLFGITALCGLFSLSVFSDNQEKIETKAADNETDVSFYYGRSNVYGYKSVDNVDWYFKFDIRANFHLTNFVSDELDSENYGLSFYHYYYTFYLDISYNNVGWNSDYTSIEISDNQPYSYDYLLRQDNFDYTYSYLNVHSSNYRYVGGQHTFYLDLYNYFYPSESNHTEYKLVNPIIEFHLTNSSTFRTKIPGLTFSPNLVYSTYLTTSSYENSFNAGYNNGFNDGYSSGKTDGYNTGYSSGYDEGLSNGQSVGYSSGYDAGVASQQQVIQNAYNEGYSSGYDLALQEDSTVLTIFSGILQVGMLPINMFLAMFNFNILGINMASFISALLTVCITIIVVKTVIGGKSGGES